MLDAKTKRFILANTEAMDLEQAARWIQNLIPNYTIVGAMDVVKESRFKMYVEGHAGNAKPWRVWSAIDSYEFKHNFLQVTMASG